ncbi:MAG: hypothetical protein NZZ41_02420 [Candidatus Dojkabacteria bacterium]|nr:hypothetical protein [Candidatus Dojkabacteria bacterium]
MKNVLYSSIVLATFVSLLGFSFLGLISINPRVYNSEISVNNFLQRNVAGIISTNNYNSDEKIHNVPPIVTLLGEKNKYNNLFLNKGEEGSYSISILLENIDKYLSIPFIKITNLSNIQEDIKLSLSVVGEISNYLTIEVQDKYNVLRLFDRGENTVQYINLEPRQTRELYLNLYSSVPVNFSFGIFFDIE